MGSRQSARCMIWRPGAGFPEDRCVDALPSTRRSASAARGRHWATSSIPCGPLMNGDSLAANGPPLFRNLASVRQSASGPHNGHGELVSFPQSPR